ncbi:MAG TPA: ribonuclease P protein component 1 [Methanothrix sp.]|uniref:ribonuclease P protein component 1 n=1 Tax=Methanothrix sp. TaxID=90426 RepID=UPI002BB3F700|nr:ribonuclease P protein component 1 [Methanothrix sp.]MDI9416667.1 ribonuclease P protein component 1 [Euryarchaeota archaeon]HON36020.1 ribonuclease P protein component 1 [Methanothrix sp.]HRU75806.1 ribonuclease P protein component 1 [Methanothrix sp.]
MRLIPSNLARHELIGLDVLVESSSEPGIVGLRGRIVDETRNTFLLEAESKVLRIPKKNASLTFTLPDGQRARVAGSVLISQPENRISKRMQRTRWKL